MGAMNGIISTEILDKETLISKLKSAPPMEGLNLVKKVTTNKIYQWSIATNEKWEFVDHHSQTVKDLLTVIVVDFGIKRNILKRLVSYGCKVIVVPVDTELNSILNYDPDGIFLSNGPGDPASVSEGINLVKLLIVTEIPIFGICMGHQILSLALGGSTFKLRFGHRGLNQPCGLSNKIEITSQNHGFAVSEESLNETIEISHFNLNDQTIAGICHKKLPFFSVQYHPEASPGPHDADYLFVKFINFMQQYRIKSNKSS